MVTIQFNFRVPIAALLAFSFFSAARARAQETAPSPDAQPLHTYFGFDVNEYPGEAALPALRKTFSFAGYWLNVPPGAKVNNWTGKRAEFVKNGFGFLVLFNGRLDRELRSETSASILGASDAKSAIAAAQREGFPVGTIIFLDQEEGGRLLPEQMAYVLAWVGAINATSFRAGIYCSAMPSKEGKTTIITANDIHEHEAARKISYFVYNDACPPSPGCIYPKNPPSPAYSGVSFAAIWQFAQSPRRREFTKACSASYNPDGNCYPPADAATGIAKQSAGIYLDLDSAISPDPSNGR
jgi:Domain of unknown function (DUF1906)